MHGVAALLAAAAVSHMVARLFRLPPNPVLLLGGLVLSLLGVAPTEMLGDALVLGVSFLLFVAGLELDPRRLRAQRTAAFQVGVAQFLILSLVGFGAARVLGLGLTEAGYVALALPASSTLVGVRLLQRRQQMFEPFGRLVLGVLLLQDLLVLLAIPLVTRISAGGAAVLAEMGGVAALGALSLMVRRFGAPLLLKLSDEPEHVLLGALSVLFVFLGASWALDLPIVVGAFLSGAALARFPVNGVVRSQVTPIGDFFAAIFFTALGALVRIPNQAELWQAGVLTLLVLVLTPPLVTLIAERAGFTSKPAIEAGLLLSQTSEISLVVGLTGMIEGVISESVFVVIALVTLATMLLTPLVATDEVAWRLMAVRGGRRRGRPTPPSDHVLLLGAGSTGMPLLEDLVLSGSDVVVVDDDPAIVRRLEEAGIPSFRGEASDPHVLRAAGADRARAVVSTIRRPRDNAALLELAASVPVLVRTFAEEDAEWIRERGGRPILYSGATADGLLAWYEGLEPQVRVPESLRERDGPPAES
jgi:Kef-type K+ transport system membrane component KefB